MANTNQPAAYHEHERTEHTDRSEFHCKNYDANHGPTTILGLAGIIVAPMKLTESMFRDMVETPMSAEEIGDLLTMTGFELEEIVEVEGEKVLDVNVMANRGDGASVLGLAREVLAKDTQARPTPLYTRLSEGCPLGDEGAPDGGRLTSVQIETPDCTRYACRVFEGLTNGEAPGWVQERLRKVGQRPISMLVDLTNYVMLETGQPLHAFDMDTLREGRIVVRQAQTGERMATLDGQEHELGPTDCMICDAERPVAVAGVMGGGDTEVSATTTRCLLESAHFDHRSVRRTRKRLGLQTDASYRFERYADPEGVVRALNRFAELLAEAMGVRPVPGVVDVYPAPPVRPTLRLRRDRAVRLLGMDVAADEIERSLLALGNRVERGGDEFQVTPPSWRIDLEREDDLVEEVGRVYGYEKIPEALPAGSTGIGGPKGAEALTDRLREEALRCGLDQTLSHSLGDLHPLDAPGKRVTVRNPHSPEMAHLRNSTLPCLAENARRNGGRDVHLFEAGRVFRDGQETVALGVLSTGGLDAPSWGGRAAQTADFFTLKAVVERLLDVAGVEATLEPGGGDPRLHPTRQATVRAAGTGQSLGLIGQVHPDVAEGLDLPATTFVAELDLTGLATSAQGELHYRPVHRTPAARRDIAIAIEKAVPFKHIEETLVAACGDVLERHWLFDVYEGKGIEPGQHSLAIALQFRKAGTFTDEEANQVRDAAVAALEALGAKLR